jgi:hypothetical protein
MKAGAAIIAGSGNHQDPAFGATLQGLVEMGIRSRSEHSLPCADIYDGNVVLKREREGPRQIELGRGSRAILVMRSKENGQTKPRATGSNPTDYIALAEYDAANAGSMRVGCPASVWHHHL